MNAEAEGGGAARVGPGDVEGVAVREDGFAPVARVVLHHALVALPDGTPADLVVGYRRAAPVCERGLPAHDFKNHVVDEGVVRVEGRTRSVHATGQRLPERLPRSLIIPNRTRADGTERR